MEQLSFNFSFGGNKKIPSFETWYAENSHEKRQFNETPYTREQAQQVYKRLIREGFFN